MHTIVKIAREPYKGINHWYVSAKDYDYQHIRDYDDDTLPKHVFKIMTEQGRNLAYFYAKWHTSDHIWIIGNQATVQDWKCKCSVSFEVVEPSAAMVGRQLPMKLDTTTVFSLKYMRNAWHSTWIQLYDPRSISFDQLELSNLAEMCRGPGNVFKIEPLRMLVLSYKRAKYGICEINRRSKYEYFRLLKEIDGDSPSKFFSHFPASSENWLLIFELKGKKIPIVMSESRAFKSKSFGPTKLLAWRPCSGGTSKQFQDFCERLRERLVKTSPQ